MPFWAPGEPLLAGAVRVTALGVTIRRNTDGTTGSSYDATEAAKWTVVSGGGGSSAPDADGSTKGLVRLTGALGGTAASPTAFGLASAAELTELAQDVTAALLLAGTHTGISFSYNDAADPASLSATVTGGGGGGGLDPGTQWISVKSYGAVGDGTTDNRTAFRNALAAAKALVTSSDRNVAIYMPSGTYRIVALSGEDVLSWGSRISLLGADRGTTRVVVETESGATQSCNFVKGLASVVAPFLDCHFRRFELDMTGVVAPASYTPTRGKGFYMQHCKRSSWTDLWVHHTKATGIGVDFLIDCHIQNNLVSDCGNFVAARGPGDSGIGIGGGMSPDEYTVVSGNIVTGCRNHGIFVEKQGASAPYWSRGFLVTGNSCRGNAVGIGDKGSQGTLIVGNIICDSTVVGIAVTTAEVGSGGDDGKETLISGNMLLGNNEGINATGARSYGRVVIRGNRVAYSAGAGIGLTYSGATTSAAAPGPAMQVVDNDIHHNVSYGINAGPTTNSGYARDLHIERNRIYNNGTGGGDTQGIRMKINVARFRLVGNVLWDDQTSRTVTDGVTTQDSATVTSATAAFTKYDVGQRITGTGIPAGATVTVLNSTTSVTISAPATATATGVTVKVGTGPTQATGIALVTGVTITDGVIRDNDARGCATPWAATLSTLAGNMVVESNPGLTRGGPLALTVTASPFTYTAGVGPEDIYVDGGTVSAIAKGGVTLAASTGTMIRLGAGESVTVTYSAAPTVVADRR